MAATPRLAQRVLFFGITMTKGKFIALAIPVTALAVFVLLKSTPLGYVALQLQRAPFIWLAMLRHHGNLPSSCRSKELDAKKPIVMSPGASLVESDRELALKWATRITLTEGYDRVGSHDPKWSKQAREFIQSALPYWVHVNGAPTAESLLPTADHLLAIGCDDPIVLLLAGQLKFDSDRQSSEAGLLFKRALHLIMGSGYKAALVRNTVERFIADCERRNEGTGQRAPLKETWVKYFALQLTDGSYTAEEQPVLTKHFSTGSGRNLFKENIDRCLETLRDRKGNSLEEWARLFLIGQGEVDLAWRDRGGGYSSTVTSAGWRSFEAHLASARKDLVTSWALNPSRPEAATEMITVVMGENGDHGESERLWFDRAIAAQFDFLKPYCSLSYAYLPRWGGSVEAMLNFGRQCAQTRRFDTLVPLQYVCVIRSIGEELESQPQIYHSAGIANELEDVFDGYESDTTKPARREYLVGLHAYAAYQGENFSRAFELLRDINFRVDPGLVAEMDPKITPAIFVERSAALGGRGGDDVAEADREFKAGNFDGASKLYESALHQNENEPHAVRYIQSKTSVIHFQKELAGGNWVSFRPSPGLNGWSSVLGDWSLENDGSLIGRAGSNGMLLVNDSGVGPDFEMRGTIDFLPDSTGEVQGGVAFGYPSFNSYDWRSFRLRRNPDNRSEVVVAQHWQAGPTRPVQTRNPNEFLVQSWRGKLTVVINGAVVFENQDLKDGLIKASNSRVGIGAYAHESNVFRVRYRDLRIRRLNSSPSLRDINIVTAGN